MLGATFMKELITVTRSTSPEIFCEKVVLEISNGF